MTPYEHLKMFCEIKGLKDPELIEKEIQEKLEFVKLADV